MKLAGVLTVMLCGLAAGLHKAVMLRKRVDALMAFKELVDALQIEIGYTALPLQELIKSNSENPICSTAIEQNCFKYDSKSALEAAGISRYSNKSDRELFCSFVRELGTSGKEGQLKHLSFYEKMVEERLESAKDEKESKSKLYLSLGAFAGITVCLVLI